MLHDIAPVTVEPSSSRITPGGARHRALAAVLGLMTASVTWVWLAVAMWAEFYWHRSRLLGFATTVPVIALVVAYTRFAERTRWRRVTALRIGGLMALFSWLLFVLDDHGKHKASWTRWIPASAVKELEFLHTSTPWVAPAVIVGLALCYYVFVYQFGRGAFFFVFAAPVIWMGLAIQSLYKASFADFDTASLSDQPGLRILAPSNAKPCSPFASECSVRLFPRGIQVDERTRTVFASFGSTFGGLHAPDTPKVMAFDLATGKTDWLECSRAGHQVRTIELDRPTHLLAFSAWMSRSVFLYDVATRSCGPELAFPLQKDEELQPAGVIIDGDGVLTANIWYPHVVRHSRATGLVERQFDLYDSGYVSEGVQLSHLFGSPRRGRAWVTTAWPGANVLEMDIKTLQPLRTMHMDATLPAHVYYDDTLGRMFVTDHGESSIEILDVDSMMRVDVLDTPRLLGSRGFAVDAAREMIYLTDYRHGELVFFSTRERRELKRMRVGPKPSEVVLSGDRLYLSTAVGLLEIRLD